jgi:elongation factor G
MPTKSRTEARCVALVGPHLSGKTTLLESILMACGAILRRGTVNDGSSVGDASPEARAHHMSTEQTVAVAHYLDERWTFIDCPGSVELTSDVAYALAVADAAVVVCEPHPERALAAASVLHALDQDEIPHILFFNKMDAPDAQVRATVDALQQISTRPLVLREIPIRDGDRVVGHVDLVSERAFRWQQAETSKMVQIPDAVKDREAAERADLLERLADFDDHLLEELLSDSVPSTAEIYDSLARDLQRDLVVPVFFGAALHGNGVRRLLKALRHEAPGPAMTAKRRDVAQADATVQVFKTVHAPHSGKLSYARVWHGPVRDGDTLCGERIGGLFRPFGAKSEKIAAAETGEVVALGRLASARTGQVLTAGGDPAPEPSIHPPEPLFALAIRADQRGDDVKLSGALAKLCEEDPSLSFGPNAETGEFLLWGQGQQHVNLALERLNTRYRLSVSGRRPEVAYRETIQLRVERRARHKKQSGGHGQFADVTLVIEPLPRGSGFAFRDTITGGVVPKAYIPAVEAGVREYMRRGPLGFPVVDIAVTLTDGQFHAVDSSEMAFKMAAQLAMREAMPGCQPVLLEPLHTVALSVPSAFTSRIQRLVSARRGHILGFEARTDRQGWDEVRASIPEAELFDLINELRSTTQGVGTFERSFDRLQELAGRDAEQVSAARVAAQ